MCDITRPMRETESQRLDRWLAEHKQDWFSVARYRVVRAQFDFSAYKNTLQILATDLTYSAAKDLQARTDAAINQEPGYQSNRMGNAVALVEVDNYEAARLAFKEVRKAREMLQSGESVSELTRG